MLRGTRPWRAASRTPFFFHAPEAVHSANLHVFIYDQGPFQWKRAWNSKWMFLLIVSIVPSGLSHISTSQNTQKITSTRRAPLSTRSTRSATKDSSTAASARNGHGSRAQQRSSLRAAYRWSRPDPCRICPRWCRYTPQHPRGKWWFFLGKRSQHPKGKKIGETGELKMITQIQGKKNRTERISILRNPRMRMGFRETQRQ